MVPENRRLVDKKWYPNLNIENSEPLWQYPRYSVHVAQRPGNGLKTPEIIGVYRVKSFRSPLAS
jgi:hypothetical protein